MHTCTKLTIKDFIGTFLGSILWTTNYGNKFILNLRSLDTESCENCLGPEVFHTLVFLEYTCKHSEVTLGMGPKPKHRIRLCFAQWPVYLCSDCDIRRGCGFPIVPSHQCSRQIQIPGLHISQQSNLEKWSLLVYLGVGRDVSQQRKLTVNLEEGQIGVHWTVFIP